MYAAAEVTAWNKEDGYGEVTLVDDGRRVWVHYSVIAAVRHPGEFRYLTPGAPVSVSVERADQDGYSWRATEVRKLPTTP